MKQIDTTSKGWEREAARSMSAGERFTLVTRDRDFVQAVQSGSSPSFRASHAGAEEPGNGSSKSDLAKALSGLASLLAGIGPTGWAIIVAAVLGIGGLIRLIRLMDKLAEKKYRFRVKQQLPGGAWEVEAEPAP